eukprot:TRINITY_DN41244_c0_g1_i1.p1 TRINITY_DN41244_c0_g1~~TRINITY_DN41244_c0_g1_i1.p1  ORF type:complete len:243 (-),score=24.79 TRINITY_DN41244_c0_g1_i1:81-809(-)
MKKLILLICLAAGLFVANSHGQEKKVAVVSFYTVKQIGLTQFNTAATIAAVTKLGDDPNFNMAPMLQSFHKQFFEDYSKSFPFQLLPEQEVLNNADYKNFAPSGSGGTGLLKDNTNLPIEGYKVLLDVVGNKDEKGLLKIFNQVDGIMKVYIDFDLVKIGIGGMGVVKVEAFTNIVLYDKKGDKVFSVRESAKSKGVSPLVAGVPVLTPEKILPMCESALTELMADLQKRLPKIIKKADSKL